MTRQVQSVQRIALPGREGSNPIMAAANGSTTTTTEDARYPSHLTADWRAPFTIVSSCSRLPTWGETTVALHLQTALYAEADPPRRDGNLVCDVSWCSRRRRQAEYLWSLAASTELRTFPSQVLRQAIDPFRAAQQQTAEAAAGRRRRRLGFLLRASSRCRGPWRRRLPGRAGRGPRGARRVGSNDAGAAQCPNDGVGGQR